MAGLGVRGDKEELGDAEVMRNTQSSEVHTCSDEGE